MNAMQVSRTVVVTKQANNIDGERLSFEVTESHDDMHIFVFGYPVLYPLVLHHLAKSLLQTPRIHFGLLVLSKSNLFHSNS